MPSKKRQTTCPPRTAVAYARYSSAGQRDVSIEQQLQDIRLFAAREGYNIVHEYADHARSGFKNARSRAAFQSMIAAADSGTFDTVIVWKVDRFGRNREDSAVYKGRLHRRGVDVVYAMEPIPVGSAGVLLEGMLEATAEWYSRQLSENVTRGMIDNANRCLYNGSRMLGYTRGSDGRFALVPEEAAVVRHIFELYCAGMSAAQICRSLNARGVRTSRNRPFAPEGLLRVINNERYTGVYIWGDIRVPDGMPVIIDRSVWEEAQAMKKKTARHIEQGTVDYLLTGKAFCGECGASMIGDSGTSRTGVTYHYYTCQARKRRSGCGKVSVRKEYLEDKVIDFLFDHCLTGEQMEAIAAAVIKAQQEAMASSPLASLEEELKESIRKRDNINDAIAEGIWDSSTKVKLTTLSERIQFLSDNIAGLKFTQRKLTDHASVVRYLKRLASGDRHDPGHRRFIVNTFLNSVYVFDDHMKIVINAVEGNSRIPLDPAEINADSGSDSVLSGVPVAIHPNSQTIVYTVGL